MNTLIAQARHRAKAIAAALLAAVTTYAVTALSTSTGLTVHGLEGAAVAALVAGVGVHQTANAPDPNAPTKRKTPGRVKKA